MSTIQHQVARPSGSSGAATSSIGCLRQWGAGFLQTTVCLGSCRVASPICHSPAHPVSLATASSLMRKAGRAAAPIAQQARCAQVRARIQRSAREDPSAPSALARQRRVQPAHMATRSVSRARAAACRAQPGTGALRALPTRAAPTRTIRSNAATASATASPARTPASLFLVRLAQRIACARHPTLPRTQRQVGSQYASLAR